MTRAIAYIPSTDYARSASSCIEYARRMGYEFKGLVQDWEIVKRMMRDGEVTCAIVANWRDLDPDRKPRLEVVSHQPNGGKWWDERTRVIRRGTWEA